MGTWKYFCTYRDRNCMFLCWNRRDKRAHRPMSAIKIAHCKSVWVLHSITWHWLTTVAIRVAGCIPDTLPAASLFLNLLCSLTIRSFNSCVISGIPTHFGLGVWIVKFVNSHLVCKRHRDKTYVIFWTSDMFTADGAIISAHDSHTDSNNDCK